MAKERLNDMVFLNLGIKLSANILKKIKKSSVEFVMVITKSFYHNGRSIIDVRNRCYSICILLVVAPEEELLLSTEDLVGSRLSESFRLVLLVSPIF